jgi:hypothetical protein
MFRFVVILAVVAVGLLAIQAPQTRESISEAVAPPTPLAAAAPDAPAPTLAARPTQTPQPITSNIVRDTLASYPTSTPPPANQPAVSILDFSYFPGILRIKTGQSGIWRNDGTEQHDVTGSDWYSGPLDPTYTHWLTFGLSVPTRSDAASTST